MALDLSALPGLSPRMRALLAEKAFLDERQLLEDSFIDFCVCAWRYVDPKPLVRTRYFDALCEHAQAFADGQIECVLNAAPPRSGKSNIISIMYGPWRWTKHPEIRFMNITYKQDLSSHFALASRRLIECDWYQERWGEKYHLMEDQNTKMRFDNNNGGSRFSASIQGGILGSGGDEIFLDDPHDSSESQSEAEFNKPIDEFEGTVTNRMNDQKKYRLWLSMQRIRENDLFNHLEKTFPNAVKLILPMEFEESRRCTTIVLPSTFPDKWTDWRMQEGELLYPERFDKAELAREKRSTATGAASWAAKYQQNPQGASGGVFDLDWFKSRFPPSRIDALCRDSEIIQSWDTAAKELATSAYSVCTTVAIQRRNVYVLDVWRKKVRPDVLEEAAFNLMERWNPSTILIEDKSTGTGLISALRHRKLDQWGRPRIGGANIIAISVSSKVGDKMHRAEMTSPFWSQGRGWLPETAEWLPEWMQEHLRFPNTTYADQVDSMSQFVNWFTRLKITANAAPANLLSIYQR